MKLREAPLAPTPPPYPLVLVRWADACGASGQGWRDIEEVGETEVVPCYSVGYLLADRTSTAPDTPGVPYVVVCPHLTGCVDPDTGRMSYDQGDGEIAIPKAWVIELVYLDPEHTPTSPARACAA